MKTKQLLVALCAGSVFAATANADIVSTFDTDAEAWFVADGSTPDNQSTTGVPSYKDTAGNSGGFITPPLPWSTHAFFVAPAAFLGDQSANFGGEISMDRRFFEPGGISEPLQHDYDVDLTMSGAGMSLGVDLAPVPLVSWGSQSVVLSTAGGWVHLGRGGPATEQEIEAVLGSLEDIRVRGNLNDLGGNMGMDNFRLAPTPGSLALLAMAGLTLAGGRRRR